MEKKCCPITGVMKKVAKAFGCKPQVSAEELHARVTTKAYELYARRGGINGDAKTDWIEAERLVKAELGL